MKGIILGITALVIVAGIAVYFASVGEPTVGLTNEENRNSLETPAETGAAQNSNGYQGAVLAGTQAPLLDFDLRDYETALPTDKLIVLYFYANWCPICREEFPKMQAAFNELTTDQVIGFRVNYNDDETDADEKSLAREFGVAYQHTKVFLKNGSRVLKAPDGWDKDRYLTEINKFLTQ